MREINSDAVKFGRNAEHVKWADDRYARCRRCGFIVHKDRDASNESQMDESKTDTAQIVYGGGPYYGATDVNYDDPNTFYGARTIYDPIVNAGCPRCGLLL